MNNNISLSLELICLMSWLLKHERQGLNSLIKHAVQHGFSKELERVEDLENSNVSEQLYTTILDFLVMLEQILMKNLETVHLDANTKDAILPALEKIDLENLDDRTIWLSMQQTKEKLSKSKSHTCEHTEQHSGEEQAQTILLEQLLKNWKLNKNESLH